MRSHGTVRAVGRVMGAAVIAGWLVLSGATRVAAAPPDHAPAAAHAHSQAPVVDAPESVDPAPDPALEPDTALEPAHVPALVEPTIAQAGATEPTGQRAPAATDATDPAETASTDDSATTSEDLAIGPVEPRAESVASESQADPATATTPGTPVSAVSPVSPVSPAAKSLASTGQSATVQPVASHTLEERTDVVPSILESTAAVTRTAVASTAAPARAVGVVNPKPRPSLPRHPLSHGPQPSAAGAPLVTLPDGAIEAGVVIGMPRMSSAVGLAVEVGRAGHGWAGALVFNLWLRRQMRERRMSQRRLAMLSGVNHSTISRLLQNGRTPSLQTASKLAHALRMQWSDEQVASYFDLLDERPVTPMQRVEAALRGDEGLSDEDVRMLMSVYLKRRTAPGARGLGAASSAASLSEPPPLRRTADP